MNGDQSGEFQWRIQGRPPPLFLDQTEAQREKKKFWDRPLPYLRVWMTADPAPSIIWRSGSAIEFVRGYGDFQGFKAPDPWRPRDSQSGWEKRRDKSFQVPSTKCQVKLGTG